MIQLTWGSIENAVINDINSSKFDKKGCKVTSPNLLRDRNLVYDSIYSNKWFHKWMKCAVCVSLEIKQSK